MTAHAMRIATWNVNSLRVRLPHVQKWLEDEKPDIALLQELKVHHEHFDASCFEDLGYHVALLGQKSWNGVGILSRFPLEDIRYGIDGFSTETDTYLHARYIEAVVSYSGGALRVASVYAPNGNPLGSDKFDKKCLFHAGFCSACR